MIVDEKPVIKILMLEDQEDDADLVKRAIRKGGIAFESFRVDDKAGFEKALNEFNPDVILSDHSLPQFNSIEALKICQEKKPGIPFILVTGAVSDEFAAQCIKIGADDYILKSNLSRLPASMKNAIEHHNLEKLRVAGEAALQEQNVRLTKAHKEIDSFVYSVSHNLRSPLASILGLINVARHEAETNTIDIFNYLNLIEKSVKKLDFTIKEILEYAQNERTEVRNEKIDLPALVSECLDRLQYISGYSLMNKQINITGEVPFYSDSFRLSIVLINLFSNAIRYYDQHKQHPLLRVKATIDETKVIIKVTDNGIGISPLHLPFVFNMFYRGTDRSDGAGLGLYIVKEIMDKLKGTIAVTSEPDLLTTFTVTLPNKTTASAEQ